MAESRVDQWKRKLLDLSLRNPLLNVRDSARFLPLEKGLDFGGESTTTAVVPYTPPEAGAVVEYKTRLCGVQGRASGADLDTCRAGESRDVGGRIPVPTV